MVELQEHDLRSLQEMYTFDFPLSPGDVHRSYVRLSALSRRCTRRMIFLGGLRVWRMDHQVCKVESWFLKYAVYQREQFRCCNNIGFFI